MLYLLYGPDTYRSRKKLREIIEEFRKKSGSDLNFHAIDAEGEEYENAADRHVFDTVPLFVSKKLVAVMYAFSASDARWDGLFSHLVRVKDSKDTIVFLWDGAVETVEQKKRLARVKPLCAGVQKFETLAGGARARWIREEARERKIALSPAELSRFASLKADSWGVVNALEQFAVGAFSPLVSSGSPARTSFELGDVFFSSHVRARAVLLSLLRQGHDEFQLFSYLVSHARTLALVKAYERIKKSVPERYGLHPYTLKKASALARVFPDTHFTDALARLFEEDVRIKTGSCRPADSLFLFLSRGRF